MPRYVYEQFKVLIPAEPQEIKRKLAKELRCPVEIIANIKIVKSSIDARKRPRIFKVLNLEFETHETLKKASKKVRLIKKSALHIGTPESFNASKREAGKPRKKNIVVGSGPAGLFAALTLAEAGEKVVLIERGAAVDERMKAIGKLRSSGVLDTESNVCFGEGGAGTYTDGKLYTRVKHPLMRWVMKRLIDFGASESILIDSHPHLGTDKLVHIIKTMREHLLALDVEILFNQKVEALICEKKCARGVRLKSGREITGDRVIFAIGHSARDTFEMLLGAGVHLEAKPFAVGLRAEHPQSLINRNQYGSDQAAALLGAANYSLTYQCGTRGVYSFCMCPGGFIVPTPTEENRMVINGMSNSNRSTPYANSGIVVQINPGELVKYGFKDSPLVGIEFQRQLEKLTYEATQKHYHAPAMTVSQFVKKQDVQQLAASNFRPGIEPVNFWDIYMPWVLEPIREGLLNFNRKIKDFVSDEANLLAVESRTSAPLRITRGDDMMSVNIKNFYPIGEGAGYAGGIMSAALDGLKLAERLVVKS